eukprot:6977494-Prymnesium_polylepis.2
MTGITALKTEGRNVKGSRPFSGSAKLERIVTPHDAGPADSHTKEPGGRRADGSLSGGRALGRESSHSWTCGSSGHCAIRLETVSTTRRARTPCVRLRCMTGESATERGRTERRSHRAPRISAPEALVSARVEALDISP